MHRVTLWLTWQNQHILKLGCIFGCVTCTLIWMLACTDVDVSEDWCDLKYCTHCQLIERSECLQIARTVALQMCGLHSIMQTNKYCQSVPHPWPWVKVTETSPNTFAMTYSLFFPNILGEAKMGCKRSKNSADSAKTNWQHNDTPDWGGLKTFDNA